MPQDDETSQTGPAGVAPTDSFEQRFSELVKGNEALIDGGGDNDQTKWDGLRDLLADEVGLDRAKIHTFKLREKSVDNCLWEGAPLFERFQLGLAFVPTPVRLSRPTVPQGFPAGVVNRMYPGPNGFDAVAVCTRGADGSWTVSDVVADKGSPTAARLRLLFPLASLHETTKASSPAPVVAVKKRAASTALVPEIAEHLREASNVVLQGPPGTGKTFLAYATLSFIAGVPESELQAYRFETLLQKSGGDVRALVSGDDAGSLVWESVQLHPNYSYDDLVRGMSAVQDGGQTRFSPEDKLLVHLAALARARPKTTVVLLLDEINRCNLASVLGELVFAMEPGARGVPVRLQYPEPPGAGTGDVLALPRNLLLLGTMNTADRSIGMVDYAIRRRFRFLDVPPDRAVVSKHYQSSARRAQLAGELFDAVNQCVLDRNLKVGHSYFMVQHDAADWFLRITDRLYLEVLPLLREYAAEGRGVRPFMAFGGATISFGPARRADDAASRSFVLAYLNS